MTTLLPLMLELFLSGICMVFGSSSLKVNDACYDWETASKRCSLLGSGQAIPQGDRDGGVVHLGGHTVPTDGRRYWIGALYRSTGLFKMGECEAFNNPETLVNQLSIINSSHPVWDCYDACADYRVFALSAATCFCKTTPSNFTRHRCTPEPFYEGSLDFHGGQSGVVEYDKQFSSPPLRKIIGGANFKKDRGPWWDSITSCKETDGVTSVRNYTLVWTRVSRRSVIEWTSSLDQSGSSSTKGTPVWCVSVSNNSGGLSTHLEDCLTLLPSLCQGNLTQTGEQLLSDAHGTAIAALAALFAIALLASFGLLGVVIYYKRQRNQERHRRLQETYVTPSSGYLPKPELETPYYTSLQYIANPHS
ncbi:uncharacterized protein [Magallana gigas]|uniref:uncharacterized protein isoform X2 n=1 Tax=Magallana gigas TaxID=29159 RepID=UPI00333F5C3C